MNTKMRAILLVGHGAPASDSPPELIGRLKEMESRRRRNHLPPDQDERDLDRTLRDWPRTPENDPYKFGLDAIAKGLKTRLSGELLKVAFNEFCAPDIPEAAQELVESGAGKITVLSVMMTPGGFHSEIEIPEEIEALRQKYPHVRFEYAWPFDKNLVADMLLQQVQLCRQNNAGQSTPTPTGNTS